MKLDDITPLILTFNEAPNIDRTLEKLKWATQILVVDSFSTDDTCELAERHRNVRLLQRPFDNHTDQWNFGLEEVETEWVLSLDADYLLSAEFTKELEKLDPDITAFYARFRYCIFGRPLQASLYPPRAVLFRKAACRYRNDGHTQLLQVNGRTGFLSTVIDHDDRKPLNRWLQEQNRYVQHEAEKLTSAGRKELGVADRIRKAIVFAPWLVLLYTLFGKRLICAGWPGWFYCFQRTYAELLLSLRLLELKLQRAEDKEQRTINKRQRLEARERDTEARPVNGHSL